MSGGVYELVDGWGVSTNEYNWILHRRQHNKRTGEPTKWVRAGYFHTPESLLQGLWRKAQREDFDSEDMLRGLEVTLERVQAAADAFHGFLEQGATDALKRAQCRLQRATG